MNRYRTSIYLDVWAENEEAAKETGQQLVKHLFNPEEEEAPKNYSEPYLGGCALWIHGDLLGNNERCKEI